jgi:two-component system, NtrC family, nitrogen regulation sensor histidine kinase NtrY
VTVSHDRRVALVALAAGFPAVVVALFVLWFPPFGTTGRVFSAEGLQLIVRIALTALVLVAWASGATMVQRRVARPLQTISNLVAALREGDFSIRARDGRSSDALGAVMLEINMLAETLRSQRLGAQEATALLRAVMAEIDVAIFAFDSGQRLALVNKYGERLLGQPGDSLVGRRADELALQSVLDATPGVRELTFPGGAGRWEVRRTRFWQGGIPHDLLVLADVSQPLREQEREAWQRLIRVIGHELNNSLAPIKSISGSLESLLARDPPPPDWREDMNRGLSVIGSRADALSRFTTAYARLARLPPPARRTVDLGPLLQRVIDLETRIRVTVRQGPDVVLSADPDQLEQLLINIVRNAADAAIETRGGVTASWTRVDSTVEITVEDEGLGVQNTSNLFVPFFTTKPGGSGIGLALSRHIAEAHGGALTLANREDARGARATVKLRV